MLEILNKQADSGSDYIGLSEEEANVRQKERLKRKYRKKNERQTKGW